MLIAVTGIVAYLNSFTVPFVLDDNFSINFLSTSKIMDLLLHGGARRVVDLTFALNYKIHGALLPGYHATNLAIHLASAATLYLLARSAVTVLSSDPAEEQPTFSLLFIPLAAALLFVSHPVQTQAVTYTIQRYTSLATFFYLLSALAFIKARCAYETKGHETRAWLWGCACLLSALLSFGSKQIAATLPVMLITMEYILFGGRLLNRRFFIVSGVLTLLIPAYLLYHWLSGTLGDFLFDLRHATTDNIYMSRSTYFLTQIRVVATYLRLLLFPINQNLFYDYPLANSLLSAPLLAALALHGILILSAAILLRLGRQSPPSQRAGLNLAALGIAWFYISLAVESSLIPIRDVIFEHRLYLPSAGFFMSVAALTALAVQNRPARIKVACVALGISTLTLCGMTIARNQIWSDSLLLWQDTARKSPNKGIVLLNLADEYLKRNMPEKALPLFVRGLEIDMNMGFRPKTGVGVALKALNIYGSRFTTGEEYILPGGIYNIGAFDYANTARWDGVFNNNMGLAYEYLQQPAKALEAYQAALTLSPDYDLAWYNLGLLTAKQGNRQLTDRAVARLKELNPPLAQELEASIPR